MSIDCHVPGGPSRYASQEEALTARFLGLSREFDRLSQVYGLFDHFEVNRQRYPWATGLLHRPEIYAARLWEYPWAVTESALEPGMCCADIGCGESAFTIFLKQMGCEAVGFDPAYGERGPYNFGVTPDFVARTGLKIVKSGAERLDWQDNYFDRVFCLSVIEHVDELETRAQGMREIARVLKPGGRAILTVDLNIKTRIVNPLELVWESGLVLCGPIDLSLPKKRFGMFHDGKQPADVFGFVLYKPDGKIEVDFSDRTDSVDMWRVSYLRDTYPALYKRPFDWLVYDLSRNSKGGRPSFITLLRIASKFLLRMYPPCR